MTPRDLEERRVEIDGEIYLLSRRGHASTPADVRRVLLAYRVGEPDVVAVVRRVAQPFLDPEFGLQAGAITVRRIGRREVELDEDLAAASLSDLLVDDVIETPLTFIAFAVVDQDGNPYLDGYYTLALPDGRVRSGALPFGELEFTGLHPGAAMLTLLEEPPPDLGERVPAVPDDLIDLPDIDVGVALSLEDLLPIDVGEPFAAGDSSYAVRLVDAAGVPLADVPLDITAAGGRTVVPTDGDGRVELGGVAPGKATVRLADPDALAAALSGREAQASGPVEPGDDEIAVTPTRLIEGVPAHSDQPLTVVLLTALEIVFTPGYRDGLALEDGSELHAFESGPVSALRMHAIGDGAHAVLPEPMPDPLEPPPPADPPPPGPTVWEPPNIYHVQAGDYLVKIAQVYLGDGARWPEIWALNKHRFPGRSPDELYVGDTLIMPPEAVPAFVGGQVQPQQGPSAPPLPPPPWMNVDVEDLADALASGNFGTVFDWLGSLPTEPPPVPEVDLGFGPEEAIFAAHVTEAALAGQVDPPPGNEQQV